MKVTYISASIIPSNMANSVNVMKMCNGLARNGHEVTLIGTNGDDKTNNIYDQYKVEDSFKIKLAKNNKISFVNRLIIGLKHSFGAELVYTRWIIAAMFLILFTNKAVVYEHHAPFTKGLYKFFESRIIKSKKVRRHIFITDSLKKYYLMNHPKISGKDLMVLPDGADISENTVNNVNSYEYDCVYVGSFQKGKGVNLVVELANKLPKLRFAIVGGSIKEVKEMRSLNYSNNIEWFGYLPHSETHKVLKNSKIALLPNQPKVFVGSANQDIGEWTSPMKLFEYMANEKAIIASDLEVLREVLVDEVNSLLVGYNDLTEWKNAILRLLSNNELLTSISDTAYRDLKNNYTWDSRARKAMLNLPT